MTAHDTEDRIEAEEEAETEALHLLTDHLTLDDLRRDSTTVVDIESAVA